MRKIFMALIILCLSVSIAGAEIPCRCGLDDCTCFIQFGDGGVPVEFIQNTLTAQGYLAAKDDHTLFDEPTLQAVLRFQREHGLPETGMMDDETLTLLLWGMLPDELDKARPDTSRLEMWVPTDGGIRHHIDQFCCGMYDPRLVSQRNALSMDMHHCGCCKPEGYVKKSKDFSAN